MPFISGNVVVKELGADTWQLLKPLIYKGKHQTFTVPAGFKTDFASIPPALAWLGSRYGVYSKAAILHDYLWDSKDVNRSDVDGIFRRTMRELGVSFLRRWVMWAAVRTSGKLKDADFKEVLTWALVAIPAIIFLAIPAIIVTTWLAMFWVLEYIIFGSLKPFSHKKVNKPRFMPWMGQK